MPYLTRPPTDRRDQLQGIARLQPMIPIDDATIHGGDDSFDLIQMQALNCLAYGLAGSDRRLVRQLFF